MRGAVRRGRVVAVTGEPGAGKTTLLRAVAGLHSPAAGGVYLEGEPIHALAPHLIVERGVVLVPEGRRLFGRLTVAENLAVGAHAARARAVRDETLATVFEIFPILRQRRGQLASALSGGQQQMLAIGRALMGRPRLLLLDEPSLGLAPLVVEQIFAVLASIAGQGGVTVVLVEQNAHLALGLASRAYVLEAGRVVGAGASTDLLADEAVRRAYRGYTAAPGGSARGAPRSSRRTCSSACSSAATTAWPRSGSRSSSACCGCSTSPTAS
jgi:branched-chain amino acid transport system ATP-binding protein